MKPIRFIYLGYYFKKLDWDNFHSFMDAASKCTSHSKLRLWVAMLSDSLKYNISILEYFQFGFYKGLSHDEKEKWAGTGFMYEYQKLMNPPKLRDILDDKELFHLKYKRFTRHVVFSRDELKNNPNLVAKLLSFKKIVLKEGHGKCGLGTHFYDSSKLNPKALVTIMDDNGFDIAESFIDQHSEMNRLSPSGVNTVRIITQLNTQNDVVILGCRQRISVNSSVDNLAAGNMAAPIDEHTGVITGPGVYSDITKKEEPIHPVTRTEIIGFQIPFWHECLNMAKQAALEHPQNRSVGWDLAVTNEGPTLIEGNHDWCKLVWQLPVKQGLKLVLEKYKREHKELK